MSFRGFATATPVIIVKIIIIEIIIINLITIPTIITLYSPLQGMHRCKGHGCLFILPDKPIPRADKPHQNATEGWRNVMSFFPQTEISHSGEI